MFYCINIGRGRKLIGNNLYSIRFFKLFSNADRLRIIALLARYKRLTTTEIGAHIYLELPTISHYLKDLLNNGILTSTSDGRRVYYALNQVFLDRFNTIFNAYIKKDNEKITDFEYSMAHAEQLSLF